MASTSVSAAAPSNPDLDEIAEYGKLPFDRFVLVNGAPINHA
jgi:hypothetical protein